GQTLGTPIQDQITIGQWTGDTATTPSYTWTDANGGVHTVPAGTTPAWSQTIAFTSNNNSNGTLDVFGKSFWGDIITAWCTAITVTRAQWTQMGGRDNIYSYSAFDPYWNNSATDNGMNGTNPVGA